MLETAEIRWFFKGQILKEIREWFNGFDNFPASTQTRTDHYLRLPDTGIGIKIREGLIEHKQLRWGEGEKWRDGDGERWSSGECSGIFRYFQKWSFPLDDTAAIPEMLMAHRESWLGIIKERSMRILVLDKNNNIKCTSYEEVKGTAVGWELTMINIQGTDEVWWTMGFEAFGTVEKLEETLIKICNTILPECPLLLTPEDCYSYPHWLNHISDF